MHLVGLSTHWNMMHGTYSVKVVYTSYYLRLQHFISPISVKNYFNVHIKTETHINLSFLERKWKIWYFSSSFVPYTILIKMLCGSVHRWIIWYTKVKLDTVMKPRKGYKSLRVPHIILWNILYYEIYYIMKYIMVPMPKIEPKVVPVHDMVKT